MNDRRPPRPRKAAHGRKAAPAKRTGKPAKRSGKPAKRTGKAGYKRAGAPKHKRTSKNTDDRNPTRSGIDYPSRKYRSREEEPEPTRERPSLRKKVTPRKSAKNQRGITERPRSKTKAPRRRKGKTTAASDELARLAGRDAKRAQDLLARAAEAYTAGRERDAMRFLRPLRDAYPDASAVRELLGLCHYRIGQYPAATKELEAFVALTDSVEQHPVLMDCLRAQRKYSKVDELWEELALASPGGALVTEGRIVLAGARADRGRLRDAIAILEKRATDVRRVQEQHLRLWYALADLYERAGEIGHARDLFLRIRKHDASFADVAERLASLR